MKRYEEITVQEAARLLAEAGEPVKGMAFKDAGCQKWYEDMLVGVNYIGIHQFIGMREGPCFLCGKVIETKPLITEEERKAIRVLFPEHNWGAWDEDGSFYTYESHPEVREGPFDNGWYNGGDSDYIQVLEDRLNGSGISWEDSLIDLTKPIE